MPTEDNIKISGIYDYVIVGGGSAGSILASRLTEDGVTSVCVLEAGPSDRHPYVRIPAGFIKLAYDPSYTFPFLTEPSEGTAGRRILIPQGRMVGGSSSLNGLVFSRGQRADYDHWAERGNQGWGYLDVLPYFKRIERHIGSGDPRLRGTEGPIPVTQTDFIHPLCEAFMAGVANAGIPRNPDFNGQDQAGVGYMQRSVHRGRRHSAAHVYLKPAMSRGLIDLRTKTTVLRLLFEGSRSVGALCLRGRNGKPHQIRARREVIVCAGTINSPKLLQISGIGPAAVLNDLGIPVRHDLPVGDNFRDHYGVRVVARVKGVKTVNELSRGLSLVNQTARWLIGKPSVLSLSTALVHWFWKSEEGLNAPDFQGVFTPASFKEGVMGMLDDYPGMTAGVNQHRPESAGYVRAKSRDPFEHPVVQPNYLAERADQQVVIKGLKLARQLLRSAELAAYFDHETMPGPDVTTDNEWLDYARRFGNTNYHLVGTCRMGRADDLTAVLDDQLRVHGVTGLRVVDASIMPTMPSANTHAATLMVAEKASDMIRGLSPQPRVEGVA